MGVGANFDIRLTTLDFEKEYKDQVLHYFFAEYKAGRTPNPDVLCNEKIKFGVFLDKAMELGADYIATGHYARLQREDARCKMQDANKLKIQNDQNSKRHSGASPASRERRGEAIESQNLILRPYRPDVHRDSRVTSCQLLKSKDKEKDQTYFLHRLSQEQLSHSLFPIGDYTKTEVRALAKKFGLPNFAKPDSQGVCFI